MTNPFFQYFQDERFSKSQSFYEEVEGQFKTYDRFQQIPLPTPQLPDTSLRAVIEGRRTCRTYLDVPVSLASLSTILHFSSGAIHGSTKRAHPSGGAMYPIETYLALARGERTGVYHYNIKDHALEQLVVESRPADLLTMFPKDPHVACASVLILYSFIKNRGYPKYGGLTYKHGLIELGTILENAYLVCSAQGLCCCALSGGDSGELSAALDLDGNEESIILGLSIGHGE